MTKRNIVHIEIPSGDVKKSSDFYRKLFGWEITRDEKMNYTMWEPRIGPGGGFSQLGENVKVGDILIYIDSEDIDADLRKVVELGGKVLNQKSEIPGIGWFGIFSDPTGNMIALYTSMHPDR
jgi:predicted enzyme related to lactoylglutathione lyase